jgi:chlorite dismutase
MAAPIVKLTKGIHVLHLFYRIDRVLWSMLSPGASAEALKKLEALCQANSAASNPRLTSYANVGGKADVVFMVAAAELAQLGQMHRDLESCFPAGSLQRCYSFLSITELPEYVTSEEDMKQSLIAEKLQPGSEEFETRFKALKERHAQYEHYRLYPELPDWEVMAFYPMSKRRTGNDNWYSLDFAKRKELMGGHARVGRKYGGRISQLITGSTGLDDWEWGVTLMAHQIDALKEIVYEMRFDEVSARYGEFGPFYVNLRLQPADLWQHLRL